MENESSTEKNVVNSSTPEKEGEVCYPQKDHGEQMKALRISEESPNPDSDEGLDNSNNKVDDRKELGSENKKEMNQDDLNNQVDESKELESENKSETYQDIKENLSEEKEPEPVFDGTEIPGMEADRKSVV